MNRPCLLAFIEDPALQVFIQKMADDKQLDYYFATPGEQLLQFVKTLAPFMMLADLSGVETSWLFKYVSEIKNIKPDFPIVAFTAAEDEGMHCRLESAGCSMIFSKANIKKQIASAIEDILRKRY